MYKLEFGFYVALSIPTWLFLQKEYDLGYTYAQVTSRLLAPATPITMPRHSSSISAALMGLRAVCRSTNKLRAFILRGTQEAQVYQIPQAR